jgi:hypothetical protein
MKSDQTWKWKQVPILKDERGSLWCECR